MSEIHLKVEQNDKVGRYALASKDLKAGEVVFEEVPFAFGPKCEHPPMCLGCYLPVDCQRLCSKCSWPVCSAECEEVAAHRDNECKVFAASGVKFQPVDDPTDICLQFECITPLRVLMATESNNDRWQAEIAPMAHHIDKRRETPIYNFVETNVVGFLRGPCKLDRFPRELVHQVCAILDVNAFEAHPANGGYSIRCLYPKLAILSHNCVPNTTHTIFPLEGFKVQARTTLDTKAGAELFSNYALTLSPTLIRRSALRDTKYFECACERCKDPTELGTHMGTLKCSKCDNGVIISTDPLNDTAAWKCTHCEFTTKAESVRRVYEVIKNEIDSVDLNVEDACQAIEARERVFRKYKSVLHPRNCYHTMLRMSLAQMYGRCEGYGLDELPDLLLERKAELCLQLLENFNVLEPGYTRQRGVILFELHAPLLLLARNNLRSGADRKDETKLKLEQVIKYLQEAYDILKLEPENTHEGQLAKSALKGLEDLRANFDELVNVEF